MDRVKITSYDVQNLADEEIDYELKVRGKFVTKDNRELRRKKLADILEIERSQNFPFPTRMSFDRSDVPSELGTCKANSCTKVYNSLVTLFYEFETLQMNPSPQISNGLIGANVSKGGGAGKPTENTCSIDGGNIPTNSAGTTSTPKNTSTAPSNSVQEFMKSYAANNTQQFAPHNQNIGPNTDTVTQPMLIAAMKEVIDNVRSFINEQRIHFERTYALAPRAQSAAGRHPHDFPLANASQPRTTAANITEAAPHVTIVPYGHTPVAKWPTRLSGMEKREDPKAMDDITLFIERVKEFMDTTRVQRSEMVEKFILLLSDAAFRHSGIVDRIVAHSVRARTVNSIYNLSDFIFDTIGCDNTPVRMITPTARKPYFKYDAFQKTRAIENATSGENVELKEVKILTAQQCYNKVQKYKNAAKSSEGGKQHSACLKCWNRNQPGHGLQECVEQETRSSCQGCGCEDVTIYACTKCSAAKVNNTSSGAHTHTLAHGHSEANQCEVIYELNYLIHIPEIDTRTRATTHWDLIKMDRLPFTGTHISVNAPAKHVKNAIMQRTKISVKTADGNIHRVMVISPTEYDFNMATPTVSHNGLVGIDFSNVFNIVCVDAPNTSYNSSHSKTPSPGRVMNKIHQAIVHASTMDEVQSTDNESIQSPTAASVGGKERQPLLWTFIVHLLQEPNYLPIIKPAGSQQFEIVNFEAFAELWARETHRPFNTPSERKRVREAIQRVLKWYHRDGDVMVRVPNTKQMYRFVPLMPHYLSPFPKKEATKQH